MNIFKFLIAVSISPLFPFFSNHSPCTCEGHFLPSSSSFPVSLDSDCFIHMVVPGENHSSIDTEISFVSQLSENPSTFSKTSGDYLHTWTIHHGLSLLNFEIPKTELIDDEEKVLSVYQRYFRFFFRYTTEECKLVIILAESFNATLFAVSGIGYGTSDRVLYLVGVDTFDRENSEILEGFSQDLYGGIGQELEISPFYAPIAFFTITKEDASDEDTNMNATSILVYCYFCPAEQIGKFHPINLFLEEEFPAVSQVKDHWSLWNSQGYGNKIVLHSPGDWEYKDVTRINCTRQDRKMYTRMNRCHYAEMLVYNNLDDALNMTYTEFRSIFRDYDYDTDFNDDWYLNINTDEWSLGKVVVNVYAATRGSYQVFKEVGYKFIYCNPRSKMTSLAWDVFLHVIDSSTWFGLLGVIAAYAVLTRKLLYSLDLIWPFFCMSTWRTHPRLFMGFYLIAIGVFLQSSYNSGTSTDFIQLMSPMQAPTLFQKGYKTWAPGVSDSPVYVRYIYDRAPLFLKKRVHELIGGKSIDEILYKPADKRYSMPSRPLPMIRDMVKRHLVVMSVGLPRYNSLMQVFGVTNWALIEDGKEKYLCAGVGVPSHIKIPDRRHASRTWGYLAGKAAGLVERWFEMGFMGRMQTLLDYKLILDRHIKWIDAGKVSEQMPVGVNSPLGITCLCLVILNLVNFGCFFGYFAFKRRSEIWSGIKNIANPQYIQTDWLP